MIKMKKKILALLLAVTCVAGMFAGCGKTEVKEEKVVVSVNGEDITEGEFLYYLLIAKNTIISAGDGEDNEEYWKTTEIEGKNAGDVARETALKNAIELTVTAQKAVEMGADNSDHVRRAQRQNFIKQSFGGSEKDYLSRIAELGMTDEDVTKVVMKDYLASQLSGMVDIDEPSDEEIREYYDKNYYRAKHILISFSNYETDGSDGHEEALKKAEEVKAMIDGGANFESLIPEYNEDTAINDSETGYIFTKDVMVKPFEEATKALKVGEISDIVETDYGYHIIKRLDAGAAYNEFLTSKSMLDQNGEMTGKDEIINFTKQEKLTVMIDEWKDKADIKTNDSVLKEIPLTASSKEK